MIYCFGSASALSILWTIRRDVDHWCPSPLNYLKRDVNDLSIVTSDPNAKLFIQVSPKQSMLNEWFQLGDPPGARGVGFGLSSNDWFLIKTDRAIDDVVLTCTDGILENDEELDLFTEHKIHTLEEHDWNAQYFYESHITLGGAQTPEHLKLLESHRSKLQIKNGKWILCK